MFPSVQTNGYVLRQKLVFGGNPVCIFAVDQVWCAPFRRSVFFTPSVVTDRGKVDPDGKPVGGNKKEDSFQTVLTPLDPEGEVHHLVEICYDTRDSATHDGSNQKGKPDYKNPPADIQQDVLPGKPIVPHGYPFDFPLEWEHP